MKIIRLIVLAGSCVLQSFTALPDGDSKTDSLLSALEKTAIDSVKVHLLHHLHEQYRYDSPDKAKDVLLQAVELANANNLQTLSVDGLNKLADFLSFRSGYDSAIAAYKDAAALAEEISYHQGLSEALIGLGNTYTSKGNLGLATKYLEDNLKLAQEINDEDGVASSFNNLGNIYTEQGEYARAMENYTMASRKYAEIGNVRNTGIAMANIGLIHQKLENYPEAIDYLARSDSIFKDQQFSAGRAFVLKNLAIIHKNLGNYPESLKYNREALGIYQQTGQLRQIGQTTQNIGNLYWEQKDYETALVYYKQALEVNTQIGDSIGIAMASQVLGNNYLSLKEPEKAQFYSNKALEIATKLGIMLTAMDASKTLADAYYLQHNYRDAFTYLLRHRDLRDSLYTIEKRDLASEIEARYQNEQKEQEIALLAAENNFQDLQIAKRENERNYLIAFAVVALALIGLIFNQYRIKYRANKKLKELDQLKSNFFANISHEFRTPLSLLMGPLKEKINASGSTEDKALLKMMYRNADRLYQLINQLLDLSKLEHGKLEIHKTSVEVNSFFRIIAASFNSLAEAKNINFTSTIPDKDLILEFDKDIIEKACNNLLSNAFKFTPEEGSVSLRAQIENDKLVIMVSDTGPGIRSEEQENIFGRFYQTPGTEKFGTGIGLALTRELVELHAGQISIDSQPPLGATFMIKIPVLNTGAALSYETLELHRLGAENTSSNGNSNGSEDVREGPSILIIEDNPDLQGYLTELLGRRNKIFSADNGEAGIQKAKEIIPDLIITDVMMPGKSGVEVCQILKNAVETNHIPIILLTARADQESRLEGLTVGADVYLQKPFDPEELDIVVSNLLEQRSKLKDKYVRLLKLVPEEIEIVNTEEKFLQNVMKIVNQNLTNPEYTTEQFCKDTGLSRMQLHRKLSSLTGYSASAFIRHQRVIRAASLLESGMSVSEVAYAAGFGSLSYFTNVFKKEYGTTPSAYADRNVNH